MYKLPQISGLGLFVAKLALAGATIAGIGLAILVQDPSESEILTPKSVEADIGSVAFEDGREFSRAMSSLGFKPRAYDMNGNVLYFASGYAYRKDPYQLMDIVQREMVAYGVNSKNWLDEDPLHEQIAGLGKEGDTPARSEKIDAISKAMLSGEVVPLSKERDYISVGSMDPGRGVEEVTKDYVAARGETPLRDFLGGFKFIDATHERSQGRTMVTAVWSEDDFDAAKMDNRSKKPQGPDPNVPACFGCKRDFRVQSLSAGEPFRQNKWTARNTGIDDTTDFYRKAMRSRGWEESRMQENMDRLAQFLPEVDAIQGRTLSLQKDGRAMTITVLPKPGGGSDVYSTEEYEDAQILGER